MLSFPNAITAARLFLGISAAIFQSIIPQSKTTIVLCLALFSISVLLDAADGYIARRMGQTSTFGKHFDRLADQLVLWSNLIVLVEYGRVYSLLVILIIMREVLICEIWNYGEILGKPIKVHVALNVRYLCQVIAVGFGIYLRVDNPLPAWCASLPNALLTCSLIVGCATLVLCLKDNACFLKQQR